MELQIQDLEKKIIEKDNEIEKLKKIIDIYENKDLIKKQKQKEINIKHKNHPAKQKYYEENKDLIIQKSKENQLKFKNENPELFKQKKKEASLKYYYKKKKEKEEEKKREEEKKKEEDEKIK